MKRLVEYASSEEEETNELPKEKKRKLPTLAPSLTVLTPVDDPAQHQGRVRAVPHVEGQYAAYVYVPLFLHHKDALYALVGDALTLAKAHVPSLHTIGRQERDQVRDARWELHISLSRPLFLRAHQREDFKHAVRQMASSMAPFDASFTTFSELMNDEGTRTFLALNVGAGHGELHRCLDLLGPTLHLLRQKVFYVDPKFHTSIAWALMEAPSSFDVASIPAAGAPDDIALFERTIPEEQQARSASPRTVEHPPDDYVRIPHFPPTLVPLLNKAYAAKLSEARTGGFVVDRISVKIGKDVFTWPLGGIK